MSTRSLVILSPLVAEELLGNCAVEPEWPTVCEPNLPM
jgi:hypothetical protein